MSKTKKYLLLLNHDPELSSSEKQALEDLKVLFPELIIKDYAINDYSYDVVRLIDGKSSWIPAKQYISALIVFETLESHYGNDVSLEWVSTYEEAKSAKKFNLSKPHRIKYFKKETELN